MLSNMDDAVLQRMVAKVLPEAELTGSLRLEGGISAVMTRVDFVSEGTNRRCILRQPRFHQDNDAATLREHRLLAYLAGSNVRCPRSLGFDISHEIVPYPYLMLEYIEGDPIYKTDDPIAYATSFADQMAAVHAIPLAGIPALERKSDRVDQRFALRSGESDVSLREDLLKDHLGQCWPPPHANDEALLHGDFWMGNVLWKDGVIAAVIDWEEACIGDPLADLASTRLDMLWVFGEDAMEALTARYLETTGADPTNLPLWDLFAAWRPADNLPEWAKWWPSLDRSDIDVDTMRFDHHRFVDAAIAALKT